MGAKISASEMGEMIGSRDEFRTTLLSIYQLAAYMVTQILIEVFVSSDLFQTTVLWRFVSQTCLSEGLREEK